MIQADGTRESYLHDAEGRLLEHTDPLKQNTRYAEELSKLIGYCQYIERDIGHYGRHERDAQRSCLMMVFRRAVFW